MYMEKTASVSHSVMYDSCDPMDCSLPSSSVHGSLQARILKWVAHSLLQGIFLTECLLHCRQILYPLSKQNLKQSKRNLETKKQKNHYAIYLKLTQSCKSIVLQQIHICVQSEKKNVLNKTEPKKPRPRILQEIHGGAGNVFDLQTILSDPYPSSAMSSSLEGR